VSADDAPTPLYAKGIAGLKVESIRRIWCEGEHNAFPDLQRFGERWYVATREGTVHGIAGFGRVRILASDDGENWESVAMFAEFGDYRRAELSVTADGRLMVLSKFNFYREAAADENRSFDARNHDGKEYHVASRENENRVALSKDGTRWSDIRPVQGARPGAWFYSGVQWRAEWGYAIDRQGRRLYRTRDGLNFEEVSDVPVGNESRIAFKPDGSMVVFFRNGSLAASPPPYSAWTLNEANKQGPHSYGGPGILALPNGRVFTASRHRVETAALDAPEIEKEYVDGTALFELAGEKLAPRLLIPGGGDRGYTGLAWHDGHLWMAYNAPSRDADKSCIYLAKIKLP
jgi:hypothetical protein